MIGGRRPLQGRKAGDRRVRVERPHTAYFRYTGPGQMVAREAASRPRSRSGRAFARVRGALFGRPLANYEDIEERLPKKKALAIFSSDAISSSAYATEEILRVLVLAGASALILSLPVAIAIALLLAIVAASYRQIGFAYPSGGGAYAVARANLGVLPALIAAGALLVDYIMTVAVSTSSAVQQIVSAVPELFPYTVLIGVSAIVLITIGNLRGLRESGNIFAIPTYLFVGSALLMIGIGMFRILVLGESAPPPNPLPGAPDPLEAVGILLILRAFASGSVALTGTEAIANGVPAFKPPEAKNAATDPGGDGGAPGDPVHRDHVRRRQLRHRADGRARDEDRHQPGRGDDLRRRQHRLLPVPGVHRADPVPRREHQLQRVPAPGRHPGAGRVHAPPVRVQGRSPRLHRRDPHPVGRGDRADRGVRRGHARADPALFGRRLPGVHDQPDAAWCATGCACAGPAGADASRSTASVRC